MSMALWMYFWDEADWVQPAAATPDQILADIARFTKRYGDSAQFQNFLIKSSKFATIRTDTSEF